MLSPRLGGGSAFFALLFWLPPMPVLTPMRTRISTPKIGTMDPSGMRYRVSEAFTLSILSYKAGLRPLRWVVWPPDPFEHRQTARRQVLSVSWRLFERPSQRQIRLFDVTGGRPSPRGGRVPTHSLQVAEGRPNVLISQLP